MLVDEIGRELVIADRRKTAVGAGLPLVAPMMLKAGVDKPEAVRRLAKSDGNFRLAIEDTVLEL